MSSKYVDHHSLVIPRSGAPAKRRGICTSRKTARCRSLVASLLGMTSSEEDGLSIGAKDALERRADFVQRAVLARALENERHRVLGARSSGAKRYERALAGGVVTRAAGLGQPLVLLAFPVP